MARGADSDVPEMSEAEARAAMNTVASMLGWMVEGAMLQIIGENPVRFGLAKNCLLPDAIHEAKRWANHPEILDRIKPHLVRYFLRVPTIIPEPGDEGEWTDFVNAMRGDLDLPVAGAPAN